MKFLKKNKGVIILYLVIMISSLIIMNDVKREEHISNTYVMDVRNG